MNTLTNLLQDHWGDLASVVGVLISITGFIITIIGVFRSQKAAQRAEKAVHEVKRAFAHTDNIMELSAAVTIMEEIKRLHRAAYWVVLPDRYSALKRLLVSIKSSNLDLPDEHQAILQGAIQHFTDLEKRVERALANHASPPNAATVNEIVSKQLDGLSEVLSATRRKAGE